LSSFPDVIKIRTRRKECGKNAARMRHAHFIRCWRTADSSCLAALARRNDKGCGVAIATFVGSTFVGMGFLGMGLIFLTLVLAGGMI
jgi:hypothetical protein